VQVDVYGRCSKAGRSFRVCWPVSQAGKAGRDVGKENEHFTVPRAHQVPTIPAVLQAGNRRRALRSSTERRATQQGFASKSRKAYADSEE
jgi:hypothetical protein